MNDTNITVKDLAIKYQVSEQAIRAFCKAHNIRKEIVQLKQGKREIYCFDENALKLIHNHYSQESKTTQASATNKRNASDTTQLLIDSLREQIKTLTAQLEIKDKQIEEQNKQIKHLQEQITEQSQERKAERQERQTLLARLLKLENKPEIETTLTPAEQPPAPSTPAAKQTPAEQQPRSRSDRGQQQAGRQPKKGIFQTSKLFNWTKKKGR